jgi:hypothetical protein
MHTCVLFLFLFLNNVFRALNSRCNHGYGSKLVNFCARGKKGGDGKGQEDFGAAVQYLARYENDLASHLGEEWDEVTVLVNSQFWLKSDTEAELKMWKRIALKQPGRVVQLVS